MFLFAMLKARVKRITVDAATTQDALITGDVWNVFAREALRRTAVETAEASNV